MSPLWSLKAIEFEVLKANFSHFSLSHPNLHTLQKFPTSKVSVIIMGGSSYGLDLVEYGMIKQGSQGRMCH